jgi:hypothetical protein
MAKKPKSDAWVHVVGTFDFAGPAGAITSVQPASDVSQVLAGGIDRIHLKGVDKNNGELFDVAVNPLINSCSPDPERGTFEEYVQLVPNLYRVDLVIDGQAVGSFAPGRAPKVDGIQLGAPVPGSSHRIPLTSKTPNAENVSYTIQVRPTDTTIWQTVGIGLPNIDLGEVDINQFPGATGLDIRVLQTDGFTEQEVFLDHRSFGTPTDAKPTPPRRKRG